MNKLSTYALSAIMLISLTSCASEQPALTQINQQPTVQAQNVTEVSVPDNSELGIYVKKEEGEEHTVVFSSYEDPATHAGKMKLRIDFQCADGRKDTITTSSSASQAFELKIAHHGGELKVVDLSKQTTVKALVNLVNALRITNDKDEAVVMVLLKDLTKLLAKK